MTSHYAIVKCDRYQTEWFYKTRKEHRDQYGYRHLAYVNDTFDEDYYMKSVMRFIGKDFNKWTTKEEVEQEIKDRKESWSRDLKEDYYGRKNILNGLCVLWSGEINLERLRVGDSLYIESVEEYLLIKKVDLNPNGEIVYYVDHQEYFDDTLEASRLKMVDQFISKNYPDVDQFSDMLKYKDDIGARKKRFIEVTTAMEEKINQIKNPVAQLINDLPPAPKTSSEFYADRDLGVVETSYPEPETKDDQDTLWQNMILFGVIGSLILLVLMLFFSVN